MPKLRHTFTISDEAHRWAIESGNASSLIDTLLLSAKQEHEHALSVLESFSGNQLLAALNKSRSAQTKYELTDQEFREIEEMTQLEAEALQVVSTYLR